MDGVFRCDTMKKESGEEISESGLVHMVKNEEKHKDDKHVDSLIMILACVLLFLIVILVILAQTR
jgi:hypothetical protein